MIVRLSTDRVAGFSRWRMFAVIFVVLILADVLFRGGEGMKTISTWKPTSPSTNRSVPIYQPAWMSEVSAPEPHVVTTDTNPVVIEPKPRPEPIRVAPSEDNAVLIRATSDQKGSARVIWTTNSSIRPGPPTKKPSAPPLPIALPN